MSKNFFKPSRAVESDTKTMRERIESDIEKFLARGGQIQKLSNGERGAPMIQSRRNLNRAQIANLMERKRAAEAAADEEE